MEFKELFREKYRAALTAARADDCDGVILGLSNLYELFAEQYGKNNGDSIVIKAKLSYWRDLFGGYISIVRQFGLRDRRVQKLFGLIEDNSIPSLGDILSGKGEVNLPPVTPNLESAVDIDGIFVSESGDENQKSIEDSIPPKPYTGEDQMPATRSDTPVEDKPIEPVAQNESEMPAVTVPDGSNSDNSDCGDDESNTNSATNTVEDKPVYTPDSLRGFIGQQHIVKILLKEIAIAKAQGRKYLDNILLLGNPGLGKSTLMQLIAKELGVKFEWMDCSQYRNSQQSLKALQNFLLKVARDNEPVVIAFDEIHMLTDELQSSLLTLLNSRVYISPPDVNGVVKRIPIDNFTFIAATTDDDKVLNTIKDRCLRLKFQMVDYTSDELKRIYKNKVASKGLTITDEAIDACIPRSRGSIRYVNSFVDGLDVALYDDNGLRVSTNIDLSVVEKYFGERGIDAIGLEKKDLEILNVIAEDASGAIGAETLSARIGLDPKKYQSEYEPYLIKIGFVSVTGRGRSLTEAAINYLKEKNEK